MVEGGRGMICIAFQAKRGVMGFSHPRLRPGLLSLRSWRLPDAQVAEGDTSSPDDRHRLSPAERATVGGREIDDGRLMIDGGRGMICIAFQAKCGSCGSHTQDFVPGYLRSAL